MANLIRIGDELRVKHDSSGVSAPVSAESIYMSVFGSTSDLKFDHLGLSFSRYPLDLRICIEFTAATDAAWFVCRVEGIYNDRSVVITDPLLRQGDHIVSGDTWFPFAKGSLQDVRSVLRAAGIERLDDVTLRQYLSLVRQRDASPLLRGLQAQDVSAEDMARRLPPAPTAGFVGGLYAYQAEGVRWLAMLSQQELGGVLGDEMGLGKTVQIICVVAQSSQFTGNPSLIIVPATLIENWRREIAKFAPATSVYVHRGQNRTGFPSVLTAQQVVVSSYETALSDMHLFNMVQWNIVVLDEAQAIKNPDAQRTRMVKSLRRRVSLAVTGTPMENRLTDLWSIFDFAVPGYLGSRSEFEASYPDSTHYASRLEPLISPFLLRRRLQDVATDLPERIDIPQALMLDETGVADYERLRSQTLQEYGGAASLVALTRLRMYCTHPFLIDRRPGDPAACSPKYTRVSEILAEVIACGGKAIIFTSYSRMIDLFLEDLPVRTGVEVDWIDGRVPQQERQERVDKFNHLPASAVLLLNPKAAGTGLNITGANHVIHYNLEWNPAVEDQASARSHRRGQVRLVTVHRLYYDGTVEEVIDRRVDAKRQLAAAAVVGVTGDVEDVSDLVAALNISPRQREGWVY